MKTRDRILHAALQLFNEQGAATVTTNAIADGTGISVGNLYYHYKNKEEILLALLKEFQADIQPLFDFSPENVSLQSWTQWWFQWFQSVESYRFLFHNHQYLVTLNGHIFFQYQKLINQLQCSQQSLLLTLKTNNELVATQADIERLAREVTLIAVFWLDFLGVQVRQARQSKPALDSALIQILGLLLPYMKVAEQMAVEDLISQYSASKP